MSKFNDLMFYVCLALAPLIVVPVAFSQYEETGFKDNDFEGGSGIFSSSLISSSFSAGLSAAGQTPFISNLDNKGLPEIIVIDGSVIKVFHKNLSLIPKDTLGLNYSSSSNAVIADLDGDGNSEIIIVSEQSNNENIFFINYTESEGLQIEKTISYNLVPDHTTDGPVAIGCDPFGICGMAYISVLNSVTERMSFATFNYDTILGFSGIIASFGDGCFPNIRLVDSGDADGDNIPEFFFNNLITTGGNSGSVFLYRVDILANGSIDSTLFDMDNSLPTYGDEFCTSSLNSRATPILAYQPLGVGDVELAWAVMQSADDFKLKKADANFNIIDDFPEATDAEGQIISNVVAGQFYPSQSGTNQKSLCVLGYQGNVGGGEDIIEALCTSDSTDDFFDQYKHRIAVSEFNNPFNVSLDAGSFDAIAHSSEQQGAIQSTCGTPFLNTDCNDAPNGNIDELITPYGVLQLSRTGLTCVTLGVCDLEILFQHNKGSGTMVPAAYDNNSKEDLILMTTSNLFYFDDSFINTPAFLSDYDTNPCVDSAIKINETISVNLVVNDADSDDVRARVTLYADDSNEQTNNFSGFFSAGSTFPFTFNMNKTITNGILRLEGQDIENSEIAILDVPFSVATNGVTAGQCFTVVDIIDQAGQPNATTPEGRAAGDNALISDPDNAIITGLATLKETSGGLGSVPIFFIIIGVIMMTVFSIAAKSGSPMAGVGMAAILGFVGLIVGSILGILSGSIIIIVVLIAVVLIIGLIKFATVGNSL